MKYKTILLTGGSGTLGSHILKSGKLENILAPSHEDLNICNPYLIEKFFQQNEIDAVIHCAALARMGECERDPIEAIEKNVIGTCNLVNEVLKIEKKGGRIIRFIYISTAAVYQGTEGNYSEEDPTNPHNKYGWTKLGAECAVNLLPDYCIIRTDFYDQTKIKFEESPIDAYCSKLSVMELAEAIAYLLEIDFRGVVNVGGDRKSYFDLYREVNPSLKPCRLDDISGSMPVAPPIDNSMDISLWKKIMMPPLSD